MTMTRSSAPARHGVQPPSTTPSRTLRPITLPNEPDAPATRPAAGRSAGPAVRGAAPKACPTCRTALDGGPVHFRCPSCQRAVMAADLDHETHAPLTVPAWARTPVRSDLGRAA
ncbi:hypothetical protein [Actinomadura gamaensis]|uniref:Uncharacterized protein n=1 Tax=Actinomadura gamaensis TaxID=1763541 RepID=A0ABV9U3Y2_9ACTN